MLRHLINHTANNQQARHGDGARLCVYVCVRQDEKGVCQCVCVCGRVHACPWINLPFFFFFFFPPALPGAVVTRVRRRSLSQLCLRWSEVRRQEEAPGAQPSSPQYIGCGGEQPQTITQTKGSGLGMRSISPLPSSPSPCSSPAES